MAITLSNRLVTANLNSANDPKYLKIGADLNKRFVLVLVLIGLIVLSVSSLKPTAATGDSWVSKAPYAYG